MGRKTFESILKQKFPLRDRLNVVITKEKKDEIKKMIEDNRWRGVLAVGNLSAALSYLN
jgi:dihydrofolate reductase